MRINRTLMREARLKSKQLRKEQECKRHNFLLCEKPNIMFGYNGPYVDGVITYYLCAKCDKKVGG